MTPKKHVDVLKDYILVIEGAIPRELCTKILKVYHNKAIEWVPARTGGAATDVVSPDVRNCSTIGLSNRDQMRNPAKNDINERLKVCAKLALDTYRECYGDVWARQDTGYDMLRYTKGGFY